MHRTGIHTTYVHTKFTYVHHARTYERLEPRCKRIMTRSVRTYVFNLFVCSCWLVVSCVLDPSNRPWKMSLADSKKALRKSMTSILHSLDDTYINSSSKSCISRVKNMNTFISAASISIYLSMRKEIQTNELIQHSFEVGKKVFIPKIIGSNPEDMIMIELKSFEEIDTFPKSKWGIPEPEFDINSIDRFSLPLIDMIIVPGVAFDYKCQRLGHGKGYYDCYLHRLRDARAVTALPITKTIVSRLPSSKAYYSHGSSK